VPTSQDEIVYKENELVVAVDSRLKGPLTDSILDVEASVAGSMASGFRFVLRPA
jgi:hypothetical protein